MLQTMLRIRFRLLTEFPNALCSRTPSTAVRETLRPSL